MVAGLCLAGKSFGLFGLTFISFACEQLQDSYGGQRAARRTWLSPTNMWNLVIEHRSSISIDAEHH